MPDDNGTEPTRSDAPSADESLFGEAAEDTEAAVADEQDANEETAQEPEGVDDGEGRAVGDETGSSEDLKVVVSIKGGRATIGVQQPSSDPYIESFDDADLSGLTQEVPAVIERARAEWEDEPVDNQQKWDTFVKERSGGNGSVVGLPEQVVVAFAAG